MAKSPLDRKGHEDRRQHDYIGNGNLDAIQMAPLGFGDDVGASINLASDIGPLPGEDAKKAIKKQTFAIDNDGGTSELRLILTRYMIDETGAALASGIVVTIGGVDYTTTTGGKIVHNIDGNTYDKLHDFVAAINVFPGFVASVLHALTTQDTGNDDYIDVAETVLNDASAGGTDTLFRDASETPLTVLRLGIPRPSDAGPMQLMEVKGLATGVTNGTIRLIRDDDREYVSDGSHFETYLADTLVAARTSYLDENILEAATIRGPVVLIIESDDLTAADYAIKYRQALTH